MLISLKCSTRQSEAAGECQLWCVILCFQSALLSFFRKYPTCLYVYHYSVLKICHMATVERKFDANAHLGVCNHYNLCVVATSCSYFLKNVRLQSQYRSFCYFVRKSLA
jgi:hypothetical protein